MPGPERTASGYRSYGGDAETRLLFITRAKGLGLSLDEIGELSAIWDGVNCDATQARLLTLLNTKRAEVATRIRELEAFDDQLAEVQARLIESPPVEGCAPDLSCCAPALGPTPLTLGIHGSITASDATPVVACTLSSEDRAARVAEFVELAEVVSTWSRDQTNIRVRFPTGDDDVGAQVRALSAREEACCGFLRFVIHDEADELCWVITAPNAEAAPALDEFLPLLDPQREAIAR